MNPPQDLLGPGLGPGLGNLANMGNSMGNPQVANASNKYVSNEGQPKRVELPKKKVDDVRNRLKMI